MAKTRSRNKTAPEEHCSLPLTNKRANKTKSKKILTTKLKKLEITLTRLTPEMIKSMTCDNCSDSSDKEKDKKNKIMNNGKREEDKRNNNDNYVKSEQIKETELIISQIAQETANSEKHLRMKNCGIHQVKHINYEEENL